MLTSYVEKDLLFNINFFWKISFTKIHNTNFSFLLNMNYPFVQSSSFCNKFLSFFHRKLCFFWIFFVFLGSLHTLLLSYYMKGSLLFIRHFQRYALPFSNSFCWFGEKMVEVVSHGVTHVEQFSYLHILYVGLELQD